MRHWARKNKLSKVVKIRVLYSATSPPKQTQSAGVYIQMYRGRLCRESNLDRRRANPPIWPLVGLPTCDVLLARWVRECVCVCVCVCARVRACVMGTQPDVCVCVYRAFKKLPEHYFILKDPQLFHHHPLSTLPRKVRIKTNCSRRFLDPSRPMLQHVRVWRHLCPFNLFKSNSSRYRSRLAQPLQIGVQCLPIIWWSFQRFFWIFILRWHKELNFANIRVQSNATHVCGK
jgi:hypothetical protein